MQTGFIFDLDGTLLDSLGDIADAVNHTLRQFGFPEQPESLIRAVTGNGAEMLIRGALPEDTEETTSEETFEESEELKKSVFEILDYSYPYPQGNEIPSRTSVTQIKELTIERMANEESEFTRPVYEPDNRRSSSDDMA